MREVGLVGVGLVGAALARRLAAAQFRVCAFDIDATRVAALADSDVRFVARIEDALACPTVIVAVYDDPQVECVLMHAIPGGSTVIDVVTGDPRFAQAMHARLAPVGVGYVDAPLSGSSTQIAQGEALALVGGEQAAIAGQQDILSAIAKSFTRFGSAGSGRAAKLASNLILGLNRAAFAEGLALAEALGLDAASFAAFIADSPARAAAAQVKAQRMISRSYAPESRIRQHRKDLELIEHAAKQSGTTLRLAPAHAALMDEAIAAGDGDLDNAAIIERYRHARLLPAR